MFFVMTNLNFVVAGSHFKARLLDYILLGNFRVRL